MKLTAQLGIIITLVITVKTNLGSYLTSYFNLVNPNLEYYSIWIGFLLAVLNLAILGRFLWLKSYRISSLVSMLLLAQLVYYRYRLTSISLNLQDGQIQNITEYQEFLKWHMIVNIVFGLVFGIVLIITRSRKNKGLLIYGIIKITWPFLIYFFYMVTKLPFNNVINFLPLVLTYVYYVELKELANQEHLSDSEQLVYQ